MRGLAWGLLLLSACGVPEQLLRVTAKLETVDRFDESQVQARLESDEGADEDGCSRFGLVKLVQATANVPFEVDVLRAETLGPRGTPRCLRLNWRSRSMLTFGPLEHDVQLPPFTVWPSGDRLAGESAQLSFGRLTFRPLPEAYLGRTSDEVDVLPARHFYEVFDERGVLAWRAYDDGVQLSFGGSAFSGSPSGMHLEGRAGTTHGGAFRIGRTYTTDTLGRPVELRFEYRLVTNDVAVAPAEMSFVPLSRGRPCAGFADPCPFTDGDFTVVAAGGATRIDVDLGVTTPVRSILVRGLTTRAPPTALRVEVTHDSEPDRFDRIVVPIDPLLFKNGVHDDARLDLQVFTGRSVRWARVSVLGAAMAPLAIDALAEVSLFE